MAAAYGFATCTGCRQRRALNSNGTMRTHDEQVKPRTTNRCPGSHRLPAEALVEVEALTATVADALESAIRRARLRHLPFLRAELTLLARAAVDALLPIVRTPASPTEEAETHA